MRKFSALILVLALICSCTGDKYIAIRGYAQGGVYQVKLNLRGVKEDPRAIKENIDSLLSKIDFTLSGYNKESMLSKFNRGEQVSPDAMFKDIYALSYRLWEESGGAFDVAAGPLYDAWGFGFSKDSLPSDAKVAQLLATCGMAHMPQDADSLVADGVKRLNFNAIAQGYSCDVVASYLYGIGVKDMLVDIGEIFCDGLNPSGKPWTIAVDTPIDGNQTPGESTSGLWSSDGGPHGVVTSGNYRKFYIKDGRKYSHTIDPRNGYPVSHQLLSATIIAPRGAEADAYATFCMVIGLDKAREFIDSRPDLEGMLIYEKDGEMRSWRSGGF
ncbi:MAG: FAD:protein FMN transferase [Bacteroidales bacterium]|nr:FAD:protein FMN transferase [Bacteroidales bacterium]